MGKLFWGKERDRQLATAARQADREARDYSRDFRQTKRPRVVRMRDSDGVSWTGTPRQIEYARDIRARLLPRIARFCEARGEWTHYQAWAGETLATSWIELEAALRLAQLATVPRPAQMRARRAG